MAKELNVFVENRPGRLRSVATALAETKINVRTMTLQDRGEYGLMKLIVNNPEAAHLMLSERGFACALKEILAISLKDKPGSFKKLMDVFFEHNINILDAYGFVIEPQQQAVFCVEVKEPQQIKKALVEKGFRLLEEELYDF